jgi:hypothetical protein
MSVIHFVWQPYLHVIYIVLDRTKMIKINLLLSQQGLHLFSNMEHEEYPLHRICAY